MCIVRVGVNRVCNGSVYWKCDCVALIGCVLGVRLCGKSHLRKAHSRQLCSPCDSQGPCPCA